ncbi:hypothetical protein ACU8NH_24215 [Rhizobium leguminosarum]
MAKQKKQRRQKFKWDGVAPHYPFGGYCAIGNTYCLTFEALQHDTESRVVWWIDRAIPKAAQYDFEKIIMDFAPDIETAMKAAEAAFLHLQEPKLMLVGAEIDREASING